MSGKISDQQAIEYALRLSEYCNGKSLEDCKRHNCVLKNVCGKPAIIEQWGSILKGVGE